MKKDILLEELDVRTSQITLMV